MFEEFLYSTLFTCAARPPPSIHFRSRTLQPERFESEASRRSIHFYRHTPYTYACSLHNNHNIFISYHTTGTVTRVYCAAALHLVSPAWSAVVSRFRVDAGTHRCTDIDYNVSHVHSFRSALVCTCMHGTNTLIPPHILISMLTTAPYRQPAIVSC
jgi:hypothetical protein